MSGLTIDIENTLIDIEVLAEKVQIMIDDLRQGYFRWDIKDIEDAWKIMPPYYNTACIKTIIADDSISDMVTRIKTLKELIGKIA